MLFVAQDVDIKWVEYQNMVKYLSQWIKHNVTVMMDRNFPSNPAELKVRRLKSSWCCTHNEWEKHIHPVLTNKFFLVYLHFGIIFSDSFTHIFIITTKTKIILNANHHVVFRG